MTVNSVKPVDISENQDGSVVLYQWTLLSANDTGTPVRMPEWSDGRSIHFWGTFGGATVIIEGSNDPLAVDFEPLHNPQGTAISNTAAGIAIVSDNVLYMRPRLSVDGVAASVNCNLLVRRLNPLRT